MREKKKLFKIKFKKILKNWKICETSGVCTNRGSIARVGGTVGLGSKVGTTDAFWEIERGNCHCAQVSCVAVRVSCFLRIRFPYLFSKKNNFTFFKVVWALCRLSIVGFARLCCSALDLKLFEFRTGFLEFSALVNLHKIYQVRMLCLHLVAWGQVWHLFH